MLIPGHANNVISLPTEQTGRPSPLGGLDDATLLERIGAGNAAAFTELVQRHHLRFYRLAYRVTGVKSEAEDIVQEAFLKIWTKPALWQIEKNTRFTTWFYRVVVNLCYDHLKKKRALPLHDEHWIIDGRESQEEMLSAAQQQQRVAAEIAELPERQRVALSLCFFEGLSNQEAADIMGLRLKALQSLLIRAKTTLKTRLQEQ